MNEYSTTQICCSSVTELLHRILQSVLPLITTVSSPIPLHNLTIAQSQSNSTQLLEDGARSKEVCVFFLVGAANLSLGGVADVKVEYILHDASMLQVNNQSRSDKAIWLVFQVAKYNYMFMISLWDEQPSFLHCCWVRKVIFKLIYKVLIFFPYRRIY